MSIEIQNYFQQNKYVVIRNFINKDMCLFFYEYCKNKVLSMDHKKTYFNHLYDPDWDGSFIDRQLETTSFNCYGDIAFDTLNALSLKKVEEYTGEELVHTYTYWRLYETDDVLKKHIDRPSCEISTTLCLGHNSTNLQDQGYIWPIYVKNLEGKDIEVDLQPGDMLIYQGTEVEHWRESFQGLNHAQVFLHYNRKNGPYNFINDGRPILGIPKNYL